MASTERRTVMCGNSTSAGRNRFVRYPLQRSRARLCAEICTPGASRLNCAWLQRSRARLCAEIRFQFERTGKIMSSFNGAAHGYARKCGIYAVERPAGKELQRSRARLCAEMLTSPRMPSVTSWLQRSRARLCAEITRGNHASQHGGSASTEPRTVMRGNNAALDSPEWKAMGFNGAAHGYARKCWPRRQRSAKATRFNGAAHGYARKSRDRTTARPDRYRFNGAAHGYARKSGASAPGRKSERKLQRSRARLCAEIAAQVIKLCEIPSASTEPRTVMRGNRQIESHKWDDVLRASTEPRTVMRGNMFRDRGRLRARHGFNGAAHGYARKSQQSMLLLMSSRSLQRSRARLCAEIRTARIICADIASGFNGAAHGYARKSDGSKEAGNLTERLQRSRARLCAEITPEAARKAKG